MCKRGNIAFLKMGGLSHVDESVLEFLEEEFQDIQIDAIDIYSLFNKRELLNLFLFAVKEYGIE